MLIESYARIATAFRAAFGTLAEPPSYRDVRDLDEADVLAAIARVEKHHLTRFYAASLLAGRVLVACKPNGKQRCCRVCGTCHGIRVWGRKVKRYFCGRHLPVGVAV